MTVAPPDSAQGSGDTRLVPSYTFEEFVIGPHNRFPHAAALAVSENLGKAYNPLFIYGPVGIGKTHLMQSVGHRVAQRDSKVRVLYVTAQQFMSEVIELLQQGNLSVLRERYRALDLLLVDDIQFLATSEATQEEFFHMFNDLHSAGKQIIMTSDRPPKMLTTLEDRLRSRFEWGLIADIKFTNFETRVAILKKKEGLLKGVHLADDIRIYIASRLKSNIRELEGFLRRIQAYSQLNNQEVSLPLVKEIMKELLPPEEWVDEPAAEVEAPPAPTEEPAEAAFSPEAPLEVQPEGTAEAVPESPLENAPESAPAAETSMDIPQTAEAALPEEAPLARPELDTAFRDIAGSFGSPESSHEFPAEPPPAEPAEAAAPAPPPPPVMPPRPQPPAPPARPQVPVPPGRPQAPAPPARPQAPMPPARPQAVPQKPPMPPQRVPGTPPPRPQNLPPMPVPAARPPAPAPATALPPVTASHFVKQEGGSETLIIPANSGQISVVFFFPQGKEKELTQAKRKFEDIIKKHKLKFSLVPALEMAYTQDAALNYEVFPEKCNEVGVLIAVVLGPSPDSPLQETIFFNRLQELFDQHQISLQIVPWDELTKDYRFLNLALDITLIRIQQKGKK